MAMDGAQLSAQLRVNDQATPVVQQFIATLNQAAQQAAAASQQMGQGVAAGTQTATQAQQLYRDAINQVAQAQGGLVASANTVSQAKTAVSQAATEAAQAIKAYGASSTQAQTASQALHGATQQLTTATNAHTQATQAAQTVTVGLGGALGMLPGHLGTAVAGFASLNVEILASQAAMLGASAAMVGVGTAIAGGLGEAVREAAAFQRTFTDVGIVSQATGEEMATFRTRALELGVASQFSSQQVAQGFYELSSAGLNSREVLAAIDPAVQAATIGHLQLGETTRLTATIMRQFGLDAGEIPKIVDIETVAVRNSLLHWNDLGAAYRNVQGSAKFMHVSLEDTTAALEIMANAGTSAAMSGTSLRTFLDRLTKPTGEAATALRGLGVEVFAADGSFKGLIPVMQEIEKAQAHWTDAQKDGVIAMLGGGRASAFLKDTLNATKEVMVDGNATVLRGTEVLQYFAEQNRNAAGAAQQASDAIKGTLQYQITVLTASVQEAAIQLGTQFLPALTSMAPVVTNTINSFIQAAPAVHAAAAAFLAVSSAGLILGGSLTALAIAGPAVVTAMGPMAVVLGPAALAIGALAVASAALAAAWVNDWGGIREAVPPAIEATGAGLQQLRADLSSTATWATEHAQQVVTAFTQMQEAAGKTPVGQVAGQIAGAEGAAIGATFEAHGAEIGEALKRGFINVLPAGGLLSIALAGVGAAAGAQDASDSAAYQQAKAAAYDSGVAAARAYANGYAIGSVELPSVNGQEVPAWTQENWAAIERGAKLAGVDAAKALSDYYITGLSGPERERVVEIAGQYSQAIANKLADPATSTVGVKELVEGYKNELRIQLPNASEAVVEGMAQASLRSGEALYLDGKGIGIRQVEGIGDGIAAAMPSLNARADALFAEHKDKLKEALKGAGDNPALIEELLKQDNALKAVAQSFGHLDAAQHAWVLSVGAASGATTEHARALVELKAERDAGYISQEQYSQALEHGTTKTEKHVDAIKTHKAALQEMVQSTDASTVAAGLWEQRLTSVVQGALSHLSPEAEAAARALLNQGNAQAAAAVTANDLGVSLDTVIRKAQGGTGSLIELRGAVDGQIAAIRVLEGAYDQAFSGITAGLSVGERAHLAYIRAVDGTGGALQYLADQAGVSGRAVQVMLEGSPSQAKAMTDALREATAEMERLGYQTEVTRQKLEAAMLGAGGGASYVSHDFYDIGQSMGQGVVAGVQGTHGALAQAGAGAVQQVADGARSHGQIHSPSQLFADDVGLPIAQGIAEGIRAGASAITNAITTAVGQAATAGQSMAVAAASNITAIMGGTGAGGVGSIGGQNPYGWQKPTGPLRGPITDSTNGAWPTWGNTGMGAGTDLNGINPNGVGYSPYGIGNIAQQAQAAGVQLRHAQDPEGAGMAWNIQSPTDQELRNWSGPLAGRTAASAAMDTLQQYLGGPRQVADFLRDDGIQRSGRGDMLSAIASGGSGGAGLDWGQLGIAMANAAKANPHLEHGANGEILEPTINSVWGDMVRGGPFSATVNPGSATSNAATIQSTPGGTSGFAGEIPMKMVIKDVTIGSGAAQMLQQWGGLVDARYTADAQKYLDMQAQDFQHDMAIRIAKAKELQTVSQSTLDVLNSYSGSLQAGSAAAGRMGVELANGTTFAKELQGYLTNVSNLQGSTHGAYMITNSGQMGGVASGPMPSMGNASIGTPQGVQYQQNENTLLQNSPGYQAADAHFQALVGPLEAQYAALQAQSQAIFQNGADPGGPSFSDVQAQMGALDAQIVAAQQTLGGAAQRARQGLDQVASTAAAVITDQRDWAFGRPALTNGVQGLTPIVSGGGGEATMQTIPWGAGGPPVGYWDGTAQKYVLPPSATPTAPTPAVSVDLAGNLGAPVLGGFTGTPGVPTTPMVSVLPGGGIPVSSTSSITINIPVQTLTGLLDPAAARDLAAQITSAITDEQRRRGILPGGM